MSETQPDRQGHIPPADSAVPPEQGGRGRSWRVLTPIVTVVVGTLFAVSFLNAEENNTPARFTDLAGLVQAESNRVNALTDRAAALNDEVNRLSEAVPDNKVKAKQEAAAKFRDPAGMTEVSGPGVTVKLADAPEEVIESTEQNLNLLVVHQQDIQAVVNAMWRAGAQAVTVQGQRIISTTGIRCEGNAVTLQGVPYAQPYVIKAVGDQAALQESIDSDSYLRVYRQQSEVADVQIGWDMDWDSEVVAPAYEGLLDITYAEPAT